MSVIARQLADVFAVGSAPKGQAGIARLGSYVSDIGHLRCRTKYGGRGTFRGRNFQEWRRPLVDGAVRS